MIGVESRAARWWGIVRLARRHLQRRWLESLLILVGIAMGVGVFTGMESLLRFAQSLEAASLRFNPEVQAVRVQGRQFDVETFYRTDIPGVRIDATFTAPMRFSLDDLLILRESLPVIGHLFTGESYRTTELLAIDGESVGTRLDLASGTEALQISLRSTSPDELSFSGRRFLAGTSFTWEDVASGARTVVLDETAAKTLFPGLTPEEVVGHALATAYSGAGADSSGAVWIIIGVVETVQDPFGPATGSAVLAYAPPGALESETYRTFLVMPAEGVATEELIRELQAYFDQVYGEGRIEVREPLAFVDSGVPVALLALSGLALLIAAVNLLNLFTARVFRRQRYTGMSVALGATRSMLFWQTTGEALVLGVLGSLGGLLIAQGVVRMLLIVLTSGMRELSGDSPLLAVGLTPTDAALGLGLGIAVSLLFGLYPGWLASRQEPAEALRTE